MKACLLFIEIGNTIVKAYFLLKINSQGIIDVCPASVFWYVDDFIGTPRCPSGIQRPLKQPELALPAVR